MKNKRDGRGKYYYKNGDIYEGDWKMNKREGKGKFYVKESDVIIEGDFVKDEVKNGKLTDNDGNVFSPLKDNKDSNHDG